MLEVVKKSIYASLGLALMTKEKVEETAKKIAVELKLPIEESEKFAKELLEKSSDAKKGLEKRIEDVVISVHEKLNAPALKKIDELEKKIEKLEKELNK